MVAPFQAVQNGLTLMLVFYNSNILPPIMESVLVQFHLLWSQGPAQQD